jgi:heterodisulfide reductase subunit A
VPNVLTQIEFERLLSGTGPTAGRLTRPSDGRPIRRAAWIQCVGSRDVQADADFCSNICCMVSIKEALLAKTRAGGTFDAAIFYMDMRTFGKSFQRYRDAAEHRHGVRFIRSRPHSLVADPSGTGVAIRWLDAAGTAYMESFDLVVLALGQLPASGSRELAAQLELPLNPWGFIETEPFSMCRTRNPGVFLGGAFSGMKDIGEAVIQASSAAANASRVIHSAGGSLALAEPPPALPEDLGREAPRVLAVLCRCGRAGAGPPPEFLAQALRSDPAVTAVETIENLCTAAGWEQLAACARKAAGNRLLIGACLPVTHPGKLKDLGRELGISAGLIEVVDITSWSSPSADEPAPASAALAELRAGVAKLKWVEPHPAVEIPVTPRALVIGGGVAGLTAALTIADHGYGVELVEADERLGGNLTWLHRTLEGHDVRAMLDDILKRVDKHPRIQVHTGSRIVQAHGEVGSFSTIIEGPDHQVRSVDHGVVILATGGAEAPAREYAWGASPAVMTQAELERQLADGRLDAKGLDTVVMIQCVGSRQEPRNYCSRVCCAAALKQAFALRERNPQASVFVLHRDMMTTGFSEAAFTRARQAGMVFIPYRLDRPPRVEPTEGGATVTVEEPILQRTAQISAQLVVLATGIVPALPRELAEAYGAHVDADGFFQEAESKWRPVDSLKEGVFACGLALSPRSIPESIATAEAAAQRALRILGREWLATGKVVAGVRHSLCSLCEQCINACPYGARMLDVDLEQVLVNPAMCQGCGTCAAVCPNDASFLEGYPAQQVLAMIDAAVN